MARVADAIDIFKLNHRIKVSNPNDELGQLAGTLNSLIARLERAVAEIQRFTADASHEIRTPLAALRSEAESTLRQPRTVEQYQQSLTTVVEEVTRLGRLADQLLSLSRHDAGLVHCRQEHLRVDALVLDVVEQLQPIAAAGQITLHTNSLIPCETIGDDLLIGRALFNVVENAIKYTLPGGDVKIQCSVVDSAIELTVTDTGIGIAQEHLPRIFDRFYRVDSSRSLASGGTGLGLAIARAAIETHEGRIDIMSDVGVGTTVTIQLPDRSRPMLTPTETVMCHSE
jgi:signal transduction histidine kinase